MSRTGSLIRVTAAYVVAVAVALVWLLWGPGTGQLWLDGLIADLIATVVVFVFSRIYENSSFYDPYWSVIPPLLAFYWWIRSDEPSNTARWWLMMAVMLVWAVRLTANWISTFPGMHHEDWRYPMVRERAGRFAFAADLFGIHVFPTLQVFAGMIPVYVVATRAGEPFGVLDVVAFVIGAGAVALEAVADLQMHRFAATKSPGEVMDRGVWAWSRHPNYFGECGVWLSFGLFGLSAAPDSWWVLTGVVTMVAMFVGVSIPMMEQRSLQRRPAYRDVVQRVSAFVPLPPRKRAV